MSPPGEHQGKRGNTDDDGKDEREVVFRIGNVPTDKVAKECRPAGPRDGAENIVEEKYFVAHVSDTCKDRGEGASNRDEACEKDSRSSVPFEKVVCELYMLLFEKSRVCALINRFADVGAKPVACVVSEDGSQKEERHEYPYVEYLDRGEHARDKKETCPGEKKAEEDARFEKNNDKEARIAKELHKCGEIKGKHRECSINEFAAGIK